MDIIKIRTSRILHSELIAKDWALFVKQMIITYGNLYPKSRMINAIFIAHKNTITDYICLN